MNDYQVGDWVTWGTGCHAYLVREVDANYLHIATDENGGFWLVNENEYHSGSFGWSSSLSREQYNLRVYKRHLPEAKPEDCL